MIVKIHPSTANGGVVAPPSKSIAHRFLICAGLSEGESVVKNLALSKDVEATIACLRAMGARVKLSGSAAYIQGVDPRKPLGHIAKLSCGESGSTLRFLIPLCLLSGEEKTLSGTPYLLSRPLGVYEELCRSRGLRFDKGTHSLTVAGRLQSGVYEIPGDISSQFISGLLFALPLLPGDSEIRISSALQSKPYIDLTLDALQAFGAEISFDDTSRSSCVFRIRGNQSYRAQKVTVEGDCSNAAFFDALNFAGGKVEITGLNPASVQGDRVFHSVFESIRNHRVVDLSDCPDLGPVAFAAAALCGEGRFTGTKRLRLKESDRIQAMREELQKLGVTLTATENDVMIHGSLRSPAEPLYGHNDHRIVMAIAVLLTVTGGEIAGAQAVEKSFPDFFENLGELGVDLEYGMDQ